METTAGDRLERIGHQSLDGGQPFLFEVEPRNRSEQSHGVGMLGRLEQPCHARALDYPPRVHHRDFVSELGDHAEIVTSSAVVGSSAMRSFGAQASAIAIITRCRMPPESR